MGLDIAFLMNAERLDVDPEDRDAYELADEIAPAGREPHRVYIPDGYADRFDGLQGGFWVGDGVVGIVAGRFGLAFSYSGYNDFRELLCRAANSRTAPELWAMEHAESDALPFGPMINFPDNEGAFGPVTSERLAADFAEHRASVIAAWLAMDPMVIRPYDLEDLTMRYDAFAKGFRAVAGNGIAIWH